MLQSLAPLWNRLVVVGTSERAGLVVATSAYGLALALLLHSGAAGWPLALRFAVACASALILPGWCVLECIMPARKGTTRRGEIPESNPPDRLALSFGVSIVLVGLVCVAAQSLHWNMATAASLLFVGTAPPLAFLWCRKPVPRPSTAARKPITRTGDFLTGLLVVGVGGLVAMLYVLGVPFDMRFGEDVYTVVIARKLLENPFLSTDNYFYRPGYQLAYIFVPYHFMLALLSKLAAADPLIVYQKLRAFSGFIAICTQYALVRCFFKNPLVAKVVVLTDLALIYSCAAGSSYLGGPPLEWGQLIPFSHYIDFGMGVSMSVGFLFVLRALERKEVLWLAPLYLLAMAIMHSRETVQVLFIGFAMAVGLLFYRPLDKQALLRLALIAVATVILGFAYKTVTAQNAVVVQFEQDAKAGYRQLLARSVQDPLFGFLSNPICDWEGRHATMEIFGKPYYTLPLFFCPLLLVFRRYRWAVVLFALLAVPIAVITVPITSVLFAMATFSTVLFSAEVFVFPWNYVLVGLIVLFGVYGFLSHYEAARKRGPGTVAMAFALLFLASSVGLSAVIGAIAPIAYHNAGFILWSIVLGSMVVLYFMEKRRQASGQEIAPPDFTALSEASFPPAAVAATVTIVLGMFLGQAGLRSDPLEMVASRCREDQQYARFHQPTLMELSLSHLAGLPEERIEWDFFTRQGLDQIPLPVMQHLRALPGQAVFEAPFDVNLLIPLFTNHYITNSGHPYMLDWAYMKQYEKRHPLFCGDADYDPAAAERYLREYGVDYVLSPPQFTPSFERRFAARYPKAFEEQGWTLWQIRR